MEIVDGEDKGDIMASYYADASGKAVDRDIVYSHELGLAIEALRDGTSIDQLWNVV